MTDEADVSVLVSFGSVCWVDILNVCIFVQFSHLQCKSLILYLLKRESFFLFTNH